MYFVNEASIVMVPFLLFFKWLVWLIERQKYEFSSAGIRYQKAFSSGFMAWDDIVEINIVSPVQRLMFRSDRAKIVISLLPSEHLQYASMRRVGAVDCALRPEETAPPNQHLWCT